MNVPDAQAAGMAAAQRILREIFATPEGRNQIVSAANKIGLSPEAQLQADADARAAALIDARLKPIEDAEKARAEAAQKAAEESAKLAAEKAEAEARSKYGLTDQGIEAVRKLQKERGIADPRDAAELLVGRGTDGLTLPASEAAAARETPAQKAQRELLRRDPTEWARNELRAGLGDIRARAARSHV